MFAIGGALVGAAALGFLGHSNGSAEPPKPTVDAAVAPVALGRLTDPDAAAAVAVASGKDILIEFAGPEAATGSFSDSDTFVRALSESFVLVRLASSVDAPAETAARVATWGQRLGITRFPTLVLLDAKGRPYAETVGDAKNADASLQVLHQLQRVKSERDREFAAAERSANLERARHLDAGLQVVGRFATGPAYVDVMRRVVELDGDNAAGLRAKYAGAVSGIDVDVAIQSEVYPLIDRGDLREAIGRIDRLLADARPPTGQRQLLLAFQGQLYFSLHDTRRALDVFDQALRIDPHGEAAATVLAARKQVIGGAF